MSTLPRDPHARPRWVRVYVRMVRPLARAALKRAELNLDDDQAVDAWIDRTAEDIDRRLPLSRVPVIGAGLEAIDRDIARTVLAQLVEQARGAVAEARAVVDQGVDKRGAGV